MMLPVYYDAMRRDMWKIRKYTTTAGGTKERTNTPGVLSAIFRYTRILYGTVVLRYISWEGEK